MERIIYYSRVTTEDIDQTLRNIKSKSHANNPARKITGALVYDGGYFVQLLEGPRESVQGIYSRINRDTRHADIRLIASGPIFQREFPDWDMEIIDMRSQKRLSHNNLAMLVKKPIADGQQRSSDLLQWFDQILITQKPRSSN